ncbi:hypothetical protein CEXT_112671, partial [Caerostris extrusa]
VALTRGRMKAGSQLPARMTGLVGSLFRSIGHALNHTKSSTPTTLAGGNCYCCAVSICLQGRFNFHRYKMTLG